METERGKRGNGVQTEEEREIETDRKKEKRRHVY
jgi:hypothetical protein